MKRKQNNIREELEENSVAITEAYKVAFVNFEDTLSEIDKTYQGKSAQGNFELCKIDNIRKQINELLAGKL